MNNEIIQQTSCTKHGFWLQDLLLCTSKTYFSTPHRMVNATQKNVDTAKKKVMQLKKDTAVTTKKVMTSDLATQKSDATKREKILQEQQER